MKTYCGFEVSSLSCHRGGRRPAAAAGDAPWRGGSQLHACHSWTEDIMTRGGPMDPPLPHNGSKYEPFQSRTCSAVMSQRAGPAAPSAAQMQRRHRLCGLTALQQTHTPTHTLLCRWSSLHADLIWCFHHSDFFRSVNLKKGSGLTWCSSSGFCWADPEERCSLSRAGLMTGWLWAFKHTRTLMEELSEIKLNVEMNPAEICSTGFWASESDKNK